MPVHVVVQMGWREGERERNRKRQKEMWGRETSGDIKVREGESELGGDV